MAASGRLCYLDTDLAELVVVKTECDELREKVRILKDEKYKFKERYVALVGEKSVAEDQVASLDREVERLSQRVQDPATEKEALEVCVRKKSEKLVVKALMRRALEEYLSWILQEGVVRVVDRVTESEEFSLGVRRLKAACVATVIEVDEKAVSCQKI